MNRARPLALLFLVGATVGPVLDGFHTHSGTLAYPDPWIYRMAFWVPLLFGTAVMQIATSHVQMDAFLKRPGRLLSWVSVLVGIATFVAAYFLSGFWQVDSLILSGVLGAIAIGIWFGFDRTWQGVLLAILTAIIGTAFESFLIRLGAFYYLAPDFVGVPYWLFFLYLSASVTVGNLGRKILLNSWRPRR